MNNWKHKHRGWRYELKYFINKTDYMLLNSMLKAMFKEDKNNKKGGYFIRSLYFDTIENDAYYEKMHGIEERKKYRLRTYDTDSEQIKFEIKNKFNNVVLKESAVITREDAVRVINQDYDVLLKYNSAILRKIYMHFKKNKMIPVVLVDYYREAYIHRQSNIRITFDHLLAKNQLNFNMFNKSVPTRLVLDKNTVIMEIKHNYLIPEWVREMLQATKHTRCAISKYCLSRIGD